MKIIKEKLFEFRDKNYAEFQAKLIPTIEKKKIIGVRTPKLKKMAKEIICEILDEKFLKELPHNYFDENQLHIFILNEIKDFNECIKKVNEFLPYIDNWATCDQLSPKCFKKYKKELLKNINRWIKSKKAYTIRFAIKMLMNHFLDENFDKKYLKIVSEVKCNSDDKYYVDMMKAWFFATALAKQYEETILYIKNKKLDVWTHNKTIEKAIESYRISNTHKKELKNEIISKIQK